MFVTVDLPRSVSNEDNDQLLRPIQDLEIKEVVFQIDKYKALGSDGFGATFFEDYWHIIHKDVCQEIKIFFAMVNY